MPPDSQDVQLSRFERYTSLFPVRSSTKFKRPESTNWRSMSQFHSLSDDEIFDSLQNEANFVRSCPIGQMTKFLVLGVPAASLYCDPRRIAIITDLLKRVGLLPVLYGSASCDEIQIFVFFKEFQKTALITQALTSLLINCGLQVTPDNLIVYNEDQDLVLPLQQGFSWLNDSLQPKVCRNEISFESALYMFIADLNKSSCDAGQLLSFQTGARTTVESIIFDCQDDFTPPDPESKLINQEPEKVTDCILKDDCPVGLHDQHTQFPELLSIQIDQSNTDTPTEIISVPEPVASAIQIVESDFSPGTDEIAQLSLLVLFDQSENEKSKKKKTAKKRKRKRGPPDI